MTGVKLGFFTRLLERAPAADRYWFAAEQARHAEQLGFDTVWVAQHHFHADEGGLPSPFVFLSHLAAQTTRIRLATGVITLPLENVVRVAEDAVVADLLSGGRLELGLGSGSTPASFAAFGVDPSDRARVYEDSVDQLLAALGGRELAHPENQLYPAGHSLLDRVWQATFSSHGGTRAGFPGHGLLLSRTQPRPDDQPDLPLESQQQPIVDAYLAALPEGVELDVTGWHRHHAGPRRAYDTTNEGWGLLLGHHRVLTPGHQWGLLHGHRQQLRRVFGCASAPVAECSLEGSEGGVDEWVAVFIRASCLDPSQAGLVEEPEVTP